MLENKEKTLTDLKDCKYNDWAKKVEKDYHNVEVDVGTIIGIVIRFIKDN